MISYVPVIQSLSLSLSESYSRIQSNAREGQKCASALLSCTTHIPFLQGTRIVDRPERFGYTGQLDSSQSIYFKTHIVRRNADMHILEARNVCYSYSSNRGTVEALKSVSCCFDCGLIYAIVGRSGSGKSTLLSLLSGLDLPFSGEVLYKGKATSGMDLDEYRRESAAVIYQNFSLFPLLTVTENIMYPMELCGVSGQAAREMAYELAAKVSLPETLMDRFPGMISGGEQQRVAIARALSMDRKLILADEPTGNLDGENSDSVMYVLTRLAHDEGCCVIIATHDPYVVGRTDVVYKMSAGILSGDETKV